MRIRSKLVLGALASVLLVSALSACQPPVLYAKPEGALSCQLSINARYIEAATSTRPDTATSRPADTGSRFLLPETKTVDLTLSRDDGSVIASHTMTISSSIDSNGSLILSGTSASLRVPFNTALALDARIMGTDNAVIASAHSDFTVSSDAATTIKLRLEPTADHPAMVGTELKTDNTIDTLTVPSANSRILPVSLVGGSDQIISFTSGAKAEDLYFYAFDSAGSLVSLKATVDDTAWQLICTPEVTGKHHLVIYNRTAKELCISALRQGAPVPTTFALAYDGNGATGGSAPAGGSYLPEAKIAVAEAGTLTRTGYVFSGWNTAADGSGTAYTEKAELVMPKADITLYAQWTALASLGVSISLANPEHITVTISGGLAILSKSGDGHPLQMSISASAGFASYNWGINGVWAHAAIIGSGNAVTVYASSLEPGGSHTLMLEAVDAAGRAWSHSFTFTVVE